jgi:hypothetical protein
MAKQRENLRRRPHSAENAKVAMESPIVQEDLPLPVVHYPNHYGTFIGFSHNSTADPVLCSCCESAVRNYFYLRPVASPLNSNPLRMAPLDSFNFPDSFARASLGKQEDPIRSLHFESRICHRCQIAIPSLHYCSAMYGGEFKQAFGWYINQTIFRAGVHRSLLICLPNVCPPDIQKLIYTLNVDGQERNRLAQVLLTRPSEASRSELRRLEKAIPKLRRKIWNIFENETRREFGMARIGEGWVSENILFQIVTRLFSGHECLRHSRPPWLEGLELDIFIPDERIAFEYQGQQHFYPVNHWGGREALEALRTRDARKAELCHLHGILLIPFDFTEPLTEQHIRLRIQIDR